MYVCAFSPGKVILLGEHFVVHGAYALVAAIGQGSTTRSTFSKVDEIISENLNLRWREGYPVPKELLPYAKALEKVRSEFPTSKKIRSLIHTNVPLSAGLGSSSSTSVSYAASVLKLLGQDKDTSSVFNVAMESERVTHGNPSGVDVFIGIEGGVHLYKRDGSKRQVNLSAPIKLIVVNTRIRRSTSYLVSKFSSRRQTFPSFFDGVVKASSQMAVLGSEYLSKGMLKEFGLLLNYQHAILSYFGVSSKPLDDLVDMSIEGGALGAKLTGAGGGGCIIVLPEQSSFETVLKRLKAYEVFVTNVPSGGLKTWEE